MSTKALSSLLHLGEVLGYDVKTPELLVAYLWIASPASYRSLPPLFALCYYCHYRQLMRAQHTLNRLVVLSEVGTSSLHVSQTAYFSLILVKYHHTRLLVRLDVELLLLDVELLLLDVELLLLDVELLLLDVELLLLDVELLLLDVGLLLLDVELLLLLASSDNNTLLLVLAISTRVM